MAGRVPGSELDDDGSIAEDVTVLAVEEDRLAFLELSIERRIRSSSSARNGFRKHRVAFDFLHDPGGTGKQIGVGHVIAVIMRQCQIRDVAWCIANLCYLWQQGLGDCEGSLRRRARGFELTVGNLTSVPDHRAAWMRNQVAGRKHFRIRELSRLESESRFPHSSNLPAVQNVQPQGLRRFSLACLLCGS